MPWSRLREFVEAILAQLDPQEPDASVTGFLAQLGNCTGTPIYSRECTMPRSSSLTMSDSSAEPARNSLGTGARRW